MSKERKSKLDKHVATILAMNDENTPLKEIAAWLEKAGTHASEAALSRFLEKKRRRRLQGALLQAIASGSNQSREVQKALARNPAPDVEMLVQLHRSLIVHLAYLASKYGEDNVDKELLKLTASMTKTVLEEAVAKKNAEFQSQRISLKDRQVTIQEKKAAAFDRMHEVAREGTKTDGGLSDDQIKQIERELNLL